MEIAKLVVNKALGRRILQGRLEMSISEINAALPSEFRECFCATPGNHPDGRRGCGDIGWGIAAIADAEGRINMKSAGLNVDAEGFVSDGESRSS